MKHVIDLLEVHLEIADTLEQACLAADDAEASTAWVDRLGQLLEWHIAGEDGLLLPEYRRREAEIPRLGNPDVVMDEHRKIEALLETARGEAGSARLFTLRRLHHLLEHHDEREAQTFKPALDRLLPAGLRAELLGEIMRTRPSLAVLQRSGPDGVARVARREWLRLEVEAGRVSRVEHGDRRVALLQGKLREHMARVAPVLAETPLVALDRMLTVQSLQGRVQTLAQEQSLIV